MGIGSVPLSHLGSGPNHTEAKLRLDDSKTGVIDLKVEVRNLDKPLAKDVVRAAITNTVGTKLQVF